MGIISSLQQKPKHVRQHVAFVAAVSITGVVVLVWLVSVPSRFSLFTESTTTEAVAEEATEPRGSLGQMIQNIRAQVGTAYDGLRSGIEPPFEGDGADPAASAAVVQSTTSTSTTAARTWTTSSTTATVAPAVIQPNNVILIATTSATTSLSTTTTP